MVYIVVCSSGRTTVPDVMVLSDSDEEIDLHCVPLAARLNNSRNNSFLADSDQSPGRHYSSSQNSTFSTGSDASQTKPETASLHEIATESSRFVWAILFEMLRLWLFYPDFSDHPLGEFNFFWGTSQWNRKNFQTTPMICELHFYHTLVHKLCYLAELCYQKWGQFFEGGIDACQHPAIKIYWLLWKCSLLFALARIILNRCLTMAQSSFMSQIVLLVYIRRWKRSFVKR